MERLTLEEAIVHTKEVAGHKMGRNIYFTDRELSMVRDYAFEATDILGNASDTAEQVDEDMENGLGSALRKLYKGCIGESKYAKYKTKRG